MNKHCSNCLKPCKLRTFCRCNGYMCRECDYRLGVCRTCNTILSEIQDRVDSIHRFLWRDYRATCWEWLTTNKRVHIIKKIYNRDFIHFDCMMDELLDYMLNLEPFDTREGDFRFEVVQHTPEDITTDTQLRIGQPTKTEITFMKCNETKGAIVYYRYRRR